MDQELSPGTQLGNYEIQAVLGAGGMGCVYAAIDTRLNRTVALKVLPGGPSAGSPGSLIREAQAASALNHPNIVTVYEAGREGPVEFLAMERVAGQTLMKRIGGRPMEIREALIAIQIADALAAAEGADFIAAAISGDGGNVAYSDIGGSIFGVPRAGGAVRKLCDRCGSVTGMSRDGRQIAYGPMSEDDLTVFDRTQQESVVVAKRPGAGSILSGVQFSPDDRWLAFHAVAAGAGVSRIWIVPAVGSLPVPEASWIPVTDGKSLERDPVWSPKGELIYFLSERDGFRCIWARKLDPVTRKPSAEPFAVMHFHSARRSLRQAPARFAQKGGLSVGNGRLVFSMGELTGDLWLEERAR